MPRPRWFILLILFIGCVFTAPFAHAQHEEYVLGEDDDWQPTSIEPGSEQALVLRARQALARGESERARAMAAAYLDKDENGAVAAQMLMIRGDALLAMGDEYKALFDYEDIARKHPGSDVFVPALEREYQIGIAYAHGMKRKFFGTFRIVDASDDAQELLILIQERLPGSRLAEMSGMQLADFYFRNAKLRLAADAYDLFIINYPASEKIDKARQRLIESYLASYRGPRYEATGLRDARARIETLRVTQPALAQRIGSDALLVRIYESEARKLLVTSQWYLSSGDPVSCEQYIRRLVKLYPDSVATLDALRSLPNLIPRLPASVVLNGPDYDAMSQSLLGISLEGISPTPQIPLPELPMQRTLVTPTPLLSNPISDSNPSGVDS